MAMEFSLRLVGFATQGLQVSHECHALREGVSNDSSTLGRKIFMLHTRPSLTTLCLAVSAALSGIPNFARADPVEDLKTQVDALLQKVSDLEQKQRATEAQSVSAAAGAVTGGATKGSFKLPGSNTSVTFGGYVKLDGVFTNPSAGVASTADLELEPGSIAVGPNAKDGERNQFKLGARQSRLFAGTSTPTAWGALTTYVEGDLYGAAGNESVSNSNNFRVRHAYGTLGGLLAGQTWTNFSDVSAYPETVDFGGSVGEIFARQAQVRWTKSFAGGQWSVALENPETVATLLNGTQFRADDDRLPDLTGMVRFNTAYGNYSIAGLARQLRVDSLSAPASREQKLGTALGVNGVVPLFSTDDVRFSVYYGNGIGRYATGFFTDALLDANGHIILPREWTATVAYRHYWAPTLRSTLALSGLGASKPEGTADTANKGAKSAHLNVIWSPVPQTNIGLEFIHASREIQNGQAGALNRVQASVQYFF